MGLTTAGYTIVRIVQHYERIESVEIVMSNDEKDDNDDDEELKIKVGLVCFKMGGINVRLVPAASEGEGEGEAEGRTATGERN